MASFKDVHSSLRALSSGDLQVAFSLVQAAGSRLVRSSVAECPESADTMNRIIIRLRSLHDIYNRWFCVIMSTGSRTSRRTAEVLGGRMVEDTTCKLFIFGRKD